MSDLSRRNFLTHTIAAASVGTIAAMTMNNTVLGADAKPAADAKPLALPEKVVVNGRIPQSACAWCYKMPLEQLAAAGEALGLKGIDLVGPNGFATLKKYNLVGTMTPSHGIGKGFNRKENHKECIDSVRKAIDATAEAGFPNVICFSGNIHDGKQQAITPEEGIANCAEGLKQIVGYAEEKNITICMELLNSKGHKDYMCDNTKWGVALCKAVGSERFKLLFDIFHMAVMGEDIPAMIKEYHPYFGHYHTGGVPKRNEIDDKQSLPYAPIAKQILETGYKGYLVHEFIPSKKDPADQIASLAKAIKICDI